MPLDFLQWSYFIINTSPDDVLSKILGPKFSIKTTFAIFGLTFFPGFFSLLVNGADGVPPQILGPGQDFMACLIGAAMCGAGLGVMFAATEVQAVRTLSQPSSIIPRRFGTHDYGLRRYHHQFLLLHIRRMATVIFSFMALFVIGIVLDYIVNGARQSVQFFIFSGSEKIADRITEDSSRCNRTRRYRLVQQTQRESIGCVGLQTPVCRDIPSGQGHRPECFHLSKLRYRRVWRRIR